jgi:PAS domain S-box-containing protein
MNFKNFFILTVLLLSPLYSLDSLKVGVWDNEPLVFMEEDGSFKGIYIDIINYIAEQENWIIQYKHGSWANGLARLKANEIDILLGIAFTVERGKIYNFNETNLVTNWGQVYLSMDSDIQSMIDLSDKRIAVQKEDIYFLALKSFEEKLNINSIYVEVEDYSEVLALVSEGKADAGLVPRIFGLYHESKYDIQRSFINFRPVELRMAAPFGKNDEILSTIDKHINNLKSNKNSFYYQSINQWIEGVNKLVIPGWLSPLRVLIILMFIVMTVAILIIVLRWQVRVRTNALLRTINAKEKTERDLRISENNYRSILEQASDGIFISDNSGKYIAVNLSGCSMLGYSHSEILTKNISDLTPPEDLSSTLFRMEKLLEGKIIVSEHRLLRKDSSKVPVEISARILSDGRLQEIIRDITDRKLAEEEKQKLEEQLRRSQKLETIGTLAGGIAHDFNNILTPIMGFTEMSLINLKENDPMHYKLEQVLNAAFRASKLVEQILLFSKQSENEHFSLLLPPLIKEALNLLRPSIPATVEIVSQIDTNCGKVLADATQIHQVIINLCTNAWQAMEEKGGRLTIKLDQTLLDEDTLKLCPRLEKGNYAKLSVIDTGAGMDEDTVEHIFEPFFTTKEVTKGTGLGLSVVHGIIRNHKGDILVLSDLGKGSAFHIYLPIENLESVSVKEEKEIVSKGNESILVVDDDVSVGNMIYHMLVSIGYTVDLYNSSTEALKAFKHHPEEYNLMITDMAMPNMTGIDLSREIQKANPDFPIIIMTGNSGFITKDLRKKSGIDKVISKPIEMKVISSAIRKVLDK